jgi:hypothetical protein
MLVLGDGECSDGDSDKEARGNRKMLYVAPRLVRAVETLVRLGNSLTDQSQTLLVNGPASIKALSIVKQNIYESLSR